MRGGKYLAEERGAFDDEPESQAASCTEADAPSARAPLYEVAAAHDGQPSLPWLRMFMTRWNAEVE
jgi:hypothetical protein